MKEQRWQDWINVLLGVWLVLAPLFGIGGIADAAAINSYLTGTLVVILAFWALARPQMWDQVIVGLLIGGVALGATLSLWTQRMEHD
jgi:hypothetical protein